MTSNLKRIKARRKPVEAWALVSRHGNGIDSFYRTEPVINPPGTPREEQEDLTIVHLVERDPRVEAELKSARRLAKAAEKVTVGLDRHGDITWGDQESLTKAVEAHTRLIAKLKEKL